MRRSSILASFGATIITCFVAFNGWTDTGGIARAEGFVSRGLSSVPSTSRKCELEAYLAKIAKNGTVTEETRAHSVALLERVEGAINRGIVPTASYTEDKAVSLIWSGPATYLHMEVSDVRDVHVFSRNKVTGEIWSTDFDQSAAIPNRVKSALRSI